MEIRWDLTPGDHLFRTGGEGRFSGRGSLRNTPVPLKRPSPSQGKPRPCPVQAFASTEESAANPRYCDCFGVP
jgi:hypothetical protein